MGTDNVDTEQSIGFRIRQNFNPALRITDRTRSSVGTIRAHPLTILRPFFFQLLFRLAHHGDFRVRVDNRWNRIVMDLSGPVHDFLNAGNSFLRGLVSQHRPRHTVSDRVNASSTGGKVLVDLNRASSVGFNSNGFQSDGIGIGNASGAKEDSLCRQRFLPLNLHHAFAVFDRC